MATRKLTSYELTNRTVNYCFC